MRKTFCAFKQVFLHAQYTPILVFDNHKQEMMIYCKYDLFNNIFMLSMNFCRVKC